MQSRVNSLEIIVSISLTIQKNLVKKFHSHMKKYISWTWTRILVAHEVKVWIPNQRHATRDSSKVALLLFVVIHPIPTCLTMRRVLLMLEFLMSLKHKILTFNILATCPNIGINFFLTPFLLHSYFLCGTTLCILYYSLH
jgi:hypothetical protein